MKLFLSLCCEASHLAYDGHHTPANEKNCWLQISVIWQPNIRLITKLLALLIHLSSVALVPINLGAWACRSLWLFALACTSLLGFLPLVFFGELNVPSDLRRKFALCFCVDIDKHDFCSCPSEDPGILTQWMILEIVIVDWCRWSTLHMCLLKLSMGYLLSWLGWFANQVEAHNLWWLL